MAVSHNSCEEAKHCSSELSRWNTTMCVMASNPHASRYAIDTATQVPIGRVADALASAVQEPPSYIVSVSCIGCETAAERKARATMQRSIIDLATARAPFGLGTLWCG